MPLKVATAAGSATRPLLATGALAAFIGLSAANVLPSVAQLVLYLVGLVAVSRRPHHFPWHTAALVLLGGAYIVIIRLAMGVELDGAMRLVRPWFEGFVLAHVLFKWCRIRDFRSITIVLGGVIAIQFLVALLMAVSPADRSALLDTIYSDESYQNPHFLGALLFRGYGFSRHHLYGFSLASGLSAALLLVAASINRAGIWQIAMAAAAAAGLLLVAVNARIGFFPVVVCYLVGVTFLFDRFYPKHMLAVVLVLLVPVMYVGVLYFGDDFETILTWLGAGVAQFGGSDQVDGSTFSDLREMLVFAPNVVELVFGSGRPCTPGEACYSDIGFIRALQEGGAMLLLLVLYLYWRLNQQLVRLFVRTTDQRLERVRRARVLLSIVVHATFIAAMVKGEAFGPSDFSRLVATLACLGLLVGTRTSRRRMVRPASQRPLEGGLPMGADRFSPAT